MNINKEPAKTKMPIDIHARFVRGAAYELKFMLPSGFFINK